MSLKQIKLGIQFKLVAILLLVSFNVKSQVPKWDLQRVNPNNSTHRKIFFVNEDLGWKISNGYSQKTEDGGATWEIIDSSLIGNKDIFFINDSIGWIIIPERIPATQQDPSYVIDRIYKTVDAGNNWTYMNASTVNDTNKRILGFSKSMYFTDSLNGWIVGTRTGNFWSTFRPGYIARTTDGGAHWIEQQSKEEVDLNSVVFLDSSTGFVVGSNGTVLQTKNKGLKWNKLNVNTKANLHKVFFLNDKTGWIVGSGGVILKTTNGGEDWNLQSTGVQFSITDVHFISETKGWATLETFSSAYLFTEDGGNTWREISLVPRDGYGNSVFFINENTGWMLSNNGTVHKTINSGSIWKVHYGLYSRYTKFYALDNQNVFAVGLGGLIMKTSNGGRNWNVTESNTKFDLLNIHFCDKNTGWAVGYGQLVSKATILKTIDGGNSWVLQGENVNSSTLRSVYAVDSMNAWAVGGRIFHTNDGGMTWKQQGNYGPGLRDVFFWNKAVGWAVGEEGRIYLTKDGGEKWTSPKTYGIYLGRVADRPKFNDVYFLDEQTGWIAADNGKVLKTVNGGTDWDSIYVGITSNILQIKFTTVNNGFITGEFGQMYTEDGGKTWINNAELEANINKQQVSDIDAIHFFDVNRGWVGFYLRSALYYFGSENEQTNSFNTDLMHESPKVYPNPFQASIKVEASKNEYKHIKIFNLQGAVVLDFRKNENLSMGDSGQLDLNLSQLNAGVYFLKLETDNRQYIHRIIKE